MKTIDKSGFLELLKQTVSNQNIQEPVIVVTSDTKFLVDLIRGEFERCYALCGHPEDKNHSYVYQQPAECEIYYYCFTRFNEYGDLQYAIDIAAKSHKPSFILLDNNTEISHFPSDILKKFPTYELSFKNSVCKPLAKFINTNGNIWDCLPEYVWMRISKFWDVTFNRLGMSPDFTFVIDDENKWTAWYNDEAFKLEKLLNIEEKYNLPNLPVKYVYENISMEDKATIAKEQLIVATIVGATTLRKSPNEVIPSLIEYFNIDTYVCPNQEEYLKQSIKESSGYDLVTVYSQLISIYIDKCSSSSDLKLQEKLGDLLNFMLESVKVEEVKVSETINILLDIASKIKVLNKRNVDGYDARCVEKAKELSVVANVSDDVKNHISDMEKQYQNVDELIKEYPEFDKIVYSDKLRSKLIK